LRSNVEHFVTLSKTLSIFDRGRKRPSALMSSEVRQNQIFVPMRLMACRLLDTEWFRSVVMITKSDTAIRLLTLAEAAIILKISKRTLHRMIQHRQIPAFKVGGQWRILESRFQEWVEEEEHLTQKAG